MSGFFKMAYTPLHTSLVPFFSSYTLFSEAFGKFSITYYHNQILKGDDTKKWKKNKSITGFSLYHGKLIRPPFKISLITFGMDLTECFSTPSLRC